jgi:hypothetical protein
VGVAAGVEVGAIVGTWMATWLGRCGSRMLAQGSRALIALSAGPAWAELVDE